MPEYALYLGCTIPYRESSYEISARKILGELGVKLIEMPEFNCCGLPFEPISHDLALSLAARNLCVAERQNLSIMTLCNGCFGAMYRTNKELRENDELRRAVNAYMQEIGMEFKGKASVKHFVQVLANEIGFDELKRRVQKPLQGLKIAAHGGCHLLRPKISIGFDDPENPTVLRRLIELTGAECVHYADEAECCGQSVLVVNEQVSLRLAGDKLRNIKAAGAQALVTVCPACHMMYDVNQRRIERMLGIELGIPVLYYSQLLGLSMGFNADELAFDRLTVSASKILDAL